MRRHLLLMACLGSGSALAAQEPARAPASDVVIVEQLGSLAINEYSFLIVRAAFDTTTNPFDLRVPPGDPDGPWAMFGRRYMALMNARPPDHTRDKALRLLWIDGVLARGDTIWAHLSTGTARRCRQGWAEDRETDIVVFVRLAPDFGHLASRTPFLFSESFGQCPEDLSGRDSTP